VIDQAPKSCEACGDLFIPRRRTTRFCGPICRGKWRYHELGRIHYRSSYRPRSCIIGPCKVCGQPHRKGQMRCELLVPKFCSECGQQFLAYTQARFCSPTCANKFHGREYYLSNRRLMNGRYRRSSRPLTCSNCGKDFENRGPGFFLYCSDACLQAARRARWRRYEEQNRDKRSAKCRDWVRRNRKHFYDYQRKWRENNPERIQRRIERAARIETKKQERNRHADVMEALRQMEALRWHIYGEGLLKHAGRRKYASKQEQKEEYRDRYRDKNRERNRERSKNERAALKIYREMGFSASRKDRGAVYQALKAELPTLKI
jgi:hypothetical protein